MRVFWKTEREFRPTDDLAYLIASNGVFRVKRNPLFTASIRLGEAPPVVSKTLAELERYADRLYRHEEQIRLHLPKPIPQGLLRSLLIIFQTVWQRYKAEAEAQLYWHEVKECFTFRIPLTYASLDSLFCYYLVPATPRDCLRVGTIHSHGAGWACQSSVDLINEQEEDGLHITLGEVMSAFPSVHARVAVDGRSFPVDPNLLFEGPSRQNQKRLPKSFRIFDPKSSYSPDSPEAEAWAAYQAAWRHPPVMVLKTGGNEVMAHLYVFVGLGGIGGPLVRSVCHWLNFQEPDSRVRLIDGGVFEPRKAERQRFRRLGNKARVLAEELHDAFPRLYFEPVSRHLDEDNVDELIPEGTVVFLAPDNHATRRLASVRAQKLQNILLISGGNEGVEEESLGEVGTVIIHHRKNGQDLTAPITEYHPEIAGAEDVLPADPSCLDQAQVVPQLYLTNQVVAGHMLSVFYAAHRGRLTFGELWCNIRTGEVTTYERAPGGAREEEEETNGHEEGEVRIAETPDEESPDEP